jgi:hypothetical protein
LSFKGYGKGTGKNGSPIVVSAGGRADDQGQEIQELWQEKDVERPEGCGLYYPFFSFPGIGAQPEDLYRHVIPWI